MKSELEAEVFAIVQIPHQIQILLGKCHARTGDGRLIIEDDVVLSGDIAIDMEDFPGKGFVLGEFDISVLVDFLEVENLEDFEVVEDSFGGDRVHAIVKI